MRNLTRAAPGQATRHAAPTPLVALALATVYLVWGSTYLGIRVAVETMPPLLMAGSRFLIAGAVMYAAGRLAGDHRVGPVGRPQWVAASIVGVALLGCGNGGVSWGEQVVPSGIAALLVATVPLWMALFARAWLGERLRRPAVAGLLVGFAGLVLLVDPGSGAGLDLAGTAVILAGALCWAAGSVYARRAPLPSRPVIANGMEMLAGGAALLAAGIATGELSDLRLDEVSGASMMALAYLIVFGSIAAFSAYTWLLRHASTSLAATYAYVNPVVAVLLGWAILDEPVTGRTLLAGAVIVAGVALIVSAQRPRAPSRAAGPAER